MERKAVITDTGFVVALLNKHDSWHEIVKNIYAQYTNIILPQTVLAEVAYLVGQAMGIRTVVAFLQNLSASRFQLMALNNPTKTVPTLALRTNSYYNHFLI